MIVVFKRWDNNEGADAILAYDADEEELWGYTEPWASNLDKVGLTEEEFSRYFTGPNLIAGEVEEDPFDDTPNAEDLLKNYPPGSEDIPDIETPEPPEPYEENDETETKAADIAADAVFDLAEGDDTGNRKSRENGVRTLSKADYERADDVLREMHKNVVEWDGDDLSKAPAAWSADEDVPKYVQETIKQVVQGGVVWDKFEGYSRQAAKAIRNSIEENLSQPQGWSIDSLVNDLQQMYSGMSDEKAANIARTETSAILNTAREEAYKERDDSSDYVYYWQGPTDHRTTEVCKEIEEEVEERGGNVPLEELRSILRRKAKKYENTTEGGTPERVSEWTPHYQCRRTFVRDVKADL